jgi:hypothetical protein
VRQLHSEPTKLVATDSQAIFDIHCTTIKKDSDAKVGAKLTRRYTRVSCAALSPSGDEIVNGYVRFSATAGYTR